MNGKPAYSIVPPAPRGRAVQDEWGMFDPNQAGLKAAFRAVRALDEPAGGESPEPAADSDHPFDLTVPDDASAPRRVRDAASEPSLSPVATPRASAADTTGRDARHAPRMPGSARAVSHVNPDENIYDLSDAEPVRRRHKPSERGAVYTLEFATRCPQCSEEITTVRVSRLLRTQVSFTSTLPRKGYIIVCPECDGILSAELSGLI